MPLPTPARPTGTLTSRAPLSPRPTGEARSRRGALLALVAAAALASACGRSSLLGDDDGCPPDHPRCGVVDGAMTDDGAMAGDGATTGDGPATSDGAETDDGATQDDGAMGGDGSFPDGLSADGILGGDGPRGDGILNGDGARSDGGGTLDGPRGDGSGTLDGPRGDGGGTFDGPRTDGGGLDGPRGDGFIDLDGGGGDGPLLDGGARDSSGPPADLVGCTNAPLDCTAPMNQASPACINRKHERCQNGIDDDGNGRTDCADPQCFGDRACTRPGREVCNNGLDDDGNGLVDCADPACTKSSACMPAMGAETCDNGVDDNGDGLADCADPQCVKFARCLGAACVRDASLGTIAPFGARVEAQLSTVDSCVSYQTCVPGGTARVLAFSLVDVTDLRLDFLQASGAAHVVSLFRAGVLQGCDANPVHCLQAGSVPSTTHTYPALAPGNYWLVVQSYAGTEGVFRVVLSTGGQPPPDGGVSPDGPITDGGSGDASAVSDGSASDGASGSDGGVSPDGGKCQAREVCNNGVDDDCNGLTDCADHACFTDPNCKARECVADIDVGAIVVGDAPKEAKFDTTPGANRYHPTCAGSSTGHDEVVRFTLKEPAGILVQWTQGGDHVFGLFQAPQPGQPCDAFQQSCYYPGGAKGGAVAWQTRPPGDYVFILKTVNGGEGPMDLFISAFAERPVEICNNGIDDDGNGLTDCNDPACFGVGNCKVPLCMPDQDLGDFVWGTQKTATVDTTSGANLYQAKCAQGSGKERVIRLTLDEPMALGFSCDETGDMVLQLTEQVNPLDLCDANRLVCADPKVLPFGCNYAVPNLQPGKYNVIVQAFAAGTEGTMHLTLTGLQENTPKTCTSQADCTDLRCVTAPVCAQFQCRADTKLGVIPYDGTPTSTVVQTSNKTTTYSTAPCLSQPGGKAGVVDFETPGQGDLTIEWAQVGNHDFALYVDQNDGLACDANPLWDCHSTGGVATGRYTLPMLPSRRYHLIVDADRPGAEGGVVLQLSGTPN